MVPGRPQEVFREVCKCVMEWSVWGDGASEKPVWSQRWRDLPDKLGRMCENPTGVTPAVSVSVSGSEAKTERFSATEVWMDG